MATQQEIEKIKTIKNKASKLALSIYSLSSDLEEAKLIVSYLNHNPAYLDDIWNKTDSAHRRQCVYCGKIYAVAKSNAPAEGFCTECDNPFFRKELMRVQKQNRRAARLNKMATLTFRQWIGTVDHFNRKCAIARKWLCMIWNTLYP